VKEKRQFKVDPSIFFQSVFAQSGSYGKAIAELVQNGVDALATEIDITVDSTHFIVADNGKGFNAREEILEMFEVLGFDHGDHNSRTFGRFGVGRCQVFSFAPTHWRTSNYSMDVNVKLNGLEYELTENLPEMKGCTISGEFYEPFSPSDLALFEREFTNLIKYAPIKVILNGKVISIDPEKQNSWNMITDDAYISLKTTGNLKIYNLGVLVKEIPAYQFGTGGTVVTKKALSLNVARNDILVSQCDVFKRLKKYIDQKSSERNVKKTKLSEGERQHLISKWVNGEMDYDEIKKMKLIGDVTGQFWPVSRLQNIKEISCCNKRWDQKAESLHKRKICWMLSKETLEEFNCENIDQFSILVKSLSGGISRYFDNLKSVKYEDVKSLLTGEYTPLEDKELTKQEYSVLKAIRAINGYVAQLVSSSINTGSRQRKINVGESDVADGWTDGNRYVYVNRNILSYGYDGQAGFIKIVMLLIHEYIHDIQSAGSHEHDQEFYENFHTVTHKPIVGEIAFKMAETYIRNREELQAKYNKKCLKERDLNFRQNSLHDTPEINGFLDQPAFA
jgi:hypothetical protein